MSSEHDHSHQAAEAQDTLQERKLELLLEERLGGHTPPDLSAQIMAAANGQASETIPVRDIQHARIGRLRRIAGISAAAASVVIGVGLMLSDQWSEKSTRSNHEQDTPSSFVGRIDQRNDGAPSIKKLGATTQDGLIFLESSTLPQKISDQIISLIAGRAFVSPSGMPSQTLLASTADVYQHNPQFNDKEIATMTNPNNWILRSGIAMCVLSGGLVFNGEALLAQDAASSSTEIDKEIDIQEREFIDQVTKAVATQTKSFEELDANGDGFLDAEEYPQLEDGRLGEVKKLSKAEYEKQIEASKKAIEELAKAFGELEKASILENALNESFDDLDTNNDGELDGDEYEILKLKKKDANTDGVVSREEWEKASATKTSSRLGVIRDDYVTHMEPDDKEAAQTMKEIAKRAAKLSGRAQELRSRLEGVRKAAKAQEKNLEDDNE